MEEERKGKKCAEMKNVPASRGKKKWTEKNHCPLMSGVKWTRTIDLYDVNVTL